MTNRINELEELPATKEAFDNFINNIASHRNIASDLAINKAINKLSKELDEDLMKEY